MDEEAPGIVELVLLFEEATPNKELELLFVVLLVEEPPLKREF